MHGVLHGLGAQLGFRVYSDYKSSEELGIQGLKVSGETLNLHREPDIGRHLSAQGPKRLVEGE